MSHFILGENLETGEKCIAHVIQDRITSIGNSSQQPGSHLLMKIHHDMVTEWIGRLRRNWRFRIEDRTVLQSKSRFHHTRMSIIKATVERASQRAVDILIAARSVDHRQAVAGEHFPEPEPDLSGAQEPFRPALNEAGESALSSDPSNFPKPDLSHSSQPFSQSSQDPANYQTTHSGGGLAPPDSLISRRRAPSAADRVGSEEMESLASGHNDDMPGVGPHSKSKKAAAAKHTNEKATRPAMSECKGGVCRMNPKANQEGYEQTSKGHRTKLPAYLFWNRKGNKTSICLVCQVARPISRRASDKNFVALPIPRRMSELEISATEVINDWRSAVAKKYSQQLAEEAATHSKVPLSQSLSSYR